MFLYTFSWLLHLLCLYNQLQSSFAEPVPGYTTELGIRRNSITRAKPRPQFIVYTSIVEYENDVSQFSEEEIAGLVNQVWDEMKAQHQLWVDDCRANQKSYMEEKRPTIMSAIAIGKEIYFASSMKANAAHILLKHENSKLAKWINACRMYHFENNVQTVPAQDAHRTQGNCGEILASALYLQKWGEFPWETQQKSKELKARVIAFGTDEETIQNPCSKPKEINGKPTISCKIWVDWQEMEVIPRGTAEEIVNVPPKSYTNPSLNEVWTIEDTSDYI